MKTSEDSSETQIALLKRDVEYVIKAVDEIKAMLKVDYVKMSDFLPVRNLVFGLVSLVLVGVFGWVGNILLSVNK